MDDQFDISEDEAVTGPDFSVVGDPRMARYGHRISARVLSHLAANYLVVTTGVLLGDGVAALWLENNDLLLIKHAGSA